jgi:hypothetical protein
MRSIMAVSLFSLLVLSAGCYHATVETGLPASNTVIDKPWASGWVYGLVPPSTISTAAQCPNGVARVETQLSFVNQLVSFLTFGIYTPMSIRVTCASSSGADLAPAEFDILVREGATYEEVQAAFVLAADQSIADGRPVYVQFR